MSTLPLVTALDREQRAAKFVYDLFQRRLLWIAAGAVLILGCLTLLVLIYLRMQAVQSGERLTQSLAQVVEEQTSRTLQATDQGLQLLASNMEQLRASGRLTQQSARELLRAQVMELRFVSAMWVLDAQGNVIYDTTGSNIGANFADRDYFQIYRLQPQTAFYIAPAIRSRVTNVWMVNASRPIRSVDGIFEGVLVAALDPVYFDQLWRTVDLGSGGSIVLLRRDGKPMMRSPFIESFMNIVSPDHPLFRDLLPQAPVGTYRANSVVDGVHRIFSYRVLSGQGELVVVVGQSYDHVLAGWRQFAGIAMAFWAAASTVVMVLCLLLNKAWRRRSRVETRAQTVTQWLTLATDAASIAVWDWDLETGQWYATPTYHTMLGFDPGEGFVGREVLLSRIHPQDRDLVNEKIRAVLGKGAASYEYEVRVQHGDGSFRWIHVNGRVLDRSADGKAKRMLGVMLDVTARKQAEDALRQSDAMYRGILNSVTAEIAVLDRDGVILAVNDPWLRFAVDNGLEPGKPPPRTGVGVNYFEVCRASAGFSSDNALKACEGIRSVMDGKLLNFRLEYPCHSPEVERWFSMSATPMGRDGSGVVVAHVDITERKRSEVALRENTRQVQLLSRRVLEAQETERRRVAIELHDELGQALTAIKINLQASERFKVQSPADLNAENIRIIEDALQQVRRLALALRPSILDDLGLVPALRWIAEQTATRSGLVVYFHPSMPEARLAPEIETACFRIVQEALTNIVRHAQATQVNIELHIDGDVLVLCVRDDGCGFDPDAMHARAVAGGSIGLLGMQERATLIGGQIQIESKPGQGSAVYLRSPLRRRGEVT